jgi:hypothetical protein
VPAASTPTATASSKLRRSRFGMTRTLLTRPVPRIEPNSEE